MSKIPTFDYRPLGFRSPTDSQKYNKEMLAIQDDLTNLYTTMNELENAMNEAKEQYIIHSFFDELYTRSLEMQIYQLRDEIRRYQAQSKNKKMIFYPNQFETSHLYPTHERAYVDQQNLIAHLPITGRSISKLYAYHELTGQTFVYPSVKVDVTPSSYANAKVEENDPIYAIDGTKINQWVRKVIFPKEEEVCHVACEMTIWFGDIIATNQLVNTVELQVFPAKSLTIEKIEYQYDGEWKLLPGWEMENDKPAPQQFASILKFCFPDTLMKALKITMKQSFGVEHNHMRVFYFGLKHVGVHYNEYESSVGRFDIPITLAVDSPRQLIKEIKPVFKNSVLFSRMIDPSLLFNYQLYTVNAQGEKEYISDKPPVIVSANQLYLKCSILKDPYNNVTPVLSHIEIIYEDVT